MAEDAAKAPVRFPFTVVRNGKCPRPLVHGSDLPRPLPLPEAVVAGVFGVMDDGHLWPNEEQIRAITEEQANEMIVLLADVTYLEWCRKHRLDPRTGRRPRTASKTESVLIEIQREIASFSERYDGCFSAYADGFGFDAADALDRYVRSFVAEHFAANGSPEVQKEMF